MVQALADYHRQSPPLHKLVAAFVGHKPRPSDAEAAADPQAVVSLAKKMRDRLPPHLRAAADRFMTLEAPDAPAAVVTDPEALP